MKKTILCIILSFVALVSWAQDMKKFNLYHPEENAEQKIADAVSDAKKEGKHVLLQVGGNWCVWCARFHDFITSDKSIDSLVRNCYVVHCLNYSEENKNLKLLAKYGYPQRFGFPVFLVLDGSGNLLHIQNSGYLEDGKKSYNREAVIGFLRDWSPAALDPKQYNE